LIDEEVSRILREADNHAVELVQKYRDKLDALAQALLDREELSEEEIRVIFGDRANDVHAPLKLRAKAPVEKSPEVNVDGDPTIGEAEASGLSISPSSEGL
jgi:cell division protease FtsH